MLRRVILTMFLILCHYPVYSQNPIERKLHELKLPSGFSIHLFADNVPGARQMTQGEKGTVFVGSIKAGRVYALLLNSSGTAADKVITIASGLRMPNGVAFKRGALYVAEISRILRFDAIEARLQRPPEPIVIYDKFPDDEQHGWKYIAFGPDGYLYVPVGMPCNICQPKLPIYGTITRLLPDGNGFEIYASGIRNTVGFDWHPVQRDLWFTDNGRDMMGDNRPPDELNRVLRKGQNYGFPYCHGKNIIDPEYGKGHSCSEFSPPEIELGPHVAALGMKFYMGDMFPSDYKNRIFIAEHGSWNRTVPIGYRITQVAFTEGTPREYSVFAEGWLGADGTAWGRPVDVLIMPDGSMLVSDDKAGVIYRISYEAGGGRTR